MLNGVRLRELRERKGWSQAQLATLAGVSQQSESDHERGRAEPDLATLRAYARSLGCTVDELLTEDAGAAEDGPDGYGRDAALALEARLRRAETELTELRERIAVLEVWIAGERHPRRPRP
jgi:transcriptional regulator with XRE-family HTH domain